MTSRTNREQMFKKTFNLKRKDRYTYPFDKMEIDEIIFLRAPAASIASSASYFGRTRRRKFKTYAGEENGKQGCFCKRIK